jgi:mannose-1-phosphate guanylyltransferase
MSTPDLPKQFLRLNGGQTMLGDTLLRVQDSSIYCCPTVISSALHADLTSSLLAEHNIDEARIICEPFSRNTAPAVALAAMSVDPDALMLILPSDQVITDVDAFNQLVVSAIPAASAGHLVTFGIKPTSPATGFGYIERGQRLEGSEGLYRAASFIEKPIEEVAQRLAKDDRHYWNAGVFLFRSGTFLSELKRHQRQIFHDVRSSLAGIDWINRQLFPKASVFENIQSISVDHAIMEPSNRVAICPAPIDWVDIGSWDAFADFIEADENGNAFVTETSSVDCHDSFINAPGFRVKAIGLRDTIMVASGGELLILARGHSEKVKKI